MKRQTLNVMLPKALKPPVLKLLLFKTRTILQNTGADRRGYNSSLITVSVLFFRLLRWLIFVQIISCRGQQGHDTPHPKVETLLCVLKTHRKLNDLFQLEALPFRLQSTPLAMLNLVQFSSVQFSRSVVSDSLRHHGPQHARLPLSITNTRSLLKLHQGQILSS